MNMPKPRSDARVMLVMLCDSALEQLDSGKQTPVTRVCFLNLWRMVEWMQHGGYPILNRSNDRFNNDNIEQVNEVCLNLIKQMRADLEKLKYNLKLLSEPSPFTVDDFELRWLVLFLKVLRHDLDLKIHPIATRTARYTAL